MTPEELEAIRVRNSAPISCDRCGQTATHQRDDLDVVRLLCADHADADDDELTEHQTQERADIAALLAEVERLRAMVPRLEWRHVDGLPARDNLPKGPDMVMCLKGLFELWVVTEFPADYPWNRSVGWWLKVNGQDARDPRDWNGKGGLCGPETGDAGKSKAVAAWQRACGGAA